MQFEKILNFLAFEGYGIFVWTALLITLVSMFIYLLYLFRAHTLMQKRLARQQKPQGNDDDT